MLELAGGGAPRERRGSRDEDASPLESHLSLRAREPGTEAQSDAIEDREAQELDRLLRPARTEGRVVEFRSDISTTGTRKRPEFARPNDGKDAEPASDERALDRVHEETGPRRTEDPRRADEAPVRPKYLASELLREDRFPVAPLRRTLRIGAVVLGVLGMGAAVGLGGTSVPGLGLLGLFAACVVLGAAPMSAGLRGAGLGLVGALGAGWLGARMVADAQLAQPTAVLCVTATVAALWFRASHWCSRPARVLVGLGLAACLAHAFGHGLDALVVHTLDWQAWIGPALSWLFVGTVVFSVLTFLDPHGSGGAWVAGGALLGWLALDAIGSMALATWPVAAGGGAFDPRAWLGPAALPLF
ncbi:MAG: hypothetical protein AB7P00_32200, partial [Sandaracinaceae bacterium]